MRYVVSIFLTVCAGTLALATQPPDPGALERYAKDGSLSKRVAFNKAIGNHRVRPDVAARTLRRLESLASGGLSTHAPLPNWQGMPTKGTNDVLVFLIEFPDYPSSNSATSISNKVFGTGDPGDYPHESLREYYLRASYNQLDIQGSVLGWYEMAHNRSWYTTQYGDGNEANVEIIKEVVDHFDASHNYAQYDNDGDGQIDYFAVVWTGPDTGWGNFWWGYQWSLYSSNLTRDGVRFYNFSWQWESRPVGGTFSPDVVIHETGHALGLPDYYDYDTSVGPDGGLGGLDMMDAGDAGHNAFSKFMLEWLTPTFVSGGHHAGTLRAAAQYPDAIAIMPGYTGSTAYEEYFMVENRHRVNNDTGAPSDGLLIWHIDATPNSRGDDFLYNNSDTTHKLLRLMEADGLEEIETGDGWADAGDYYNQGETFTPVTSPNSSSYAPSNTFVYVTNISPNAVTMTVNCDIITTGIPATLYINPPNMAALTPAGTDAATQTFEVWIPGGTNLSYSVSETSSWLSVSPPTAQSSGEKHTHSVVFDTDALSSGSYQTTLTISAPGAVGSPEHLPITLQILGTNLPNAVDAPLMPWRTGGDGMWSSQTAVTRDGEDAAQSGAITDAESSWIETDVEGPGTIDFWWKVSSEEGWDYLRFYVDNVRQPIDLSGLQEWQRVTTYVDPGSHTLQWAYTKDSSESAGTDTAWLDTVSWVPDMRDADHDGLKDWEEDITGTDGTNAAATFIVSDVAVQPSGDVVLTWASTTGRLYSVACSTNLTEGFTVIATNLPATLPNNVYTTTPPAGVGASYRVAVMTSRQKITLIDEPFESGTIPPGWSQYDYAGYGAYWLFGDPAHRSNWTGGAGKFAIADSDYAGNIPMEVDLGTPTLDCSDLESVFIAFDTDFYVYSGFELVSVDISVNGGGWESVWSKSGDSYFGPARETVDISSRAAGQATVDITFYYVGEWDWWWQLDNVQVYGYTP